MKKEAKKRKRLPKQSSKPREGAEFELLKTVGRRIDKDRYNLKKTLEWLAIESDTSRATVRRIVDAKYNITLITLDRVAKALGYKDAVDFFKKF